MFKGLEIVSRESACKNIFEDLSALITLICLIVGLYYCIFSINEVHRVKVKLEHMQEKELLKSHLDNTYRVNRMMGMDLEILWDKFGRFQLLLLSLLMGTICWIFNIIILNFLSEEYTSTYNCTLIYPLAFNKVRPEETSLVVQVMSAISEIITCLLKDLFPIMYMLYTIADSSGK